ncbi:MAG: hypothetical protein EZS28_018453 [Streblomastix strix]|uniref:Uncharacterized protein n=1 Tax=Streblomastix strix TaxID=222440 RepID=A0A5J4VTQ3_9EUKA|nr:MAG: hypothetical protein EZS28_018453 [Streblomastix strix]
MKPSVALLQIPPYVEPSYASPSYGQGYSGYLQQSSVYQPPVGYQPPIGYQQEMDQYVSQPDTLIAQRFATFYTLEASQGRVNSNAVIYICAPNGVACTSDVARQILSTAAGPEQKVTQDKFVYHVGMYMSKNIKR